MVKELLPRVTLGFVRYRAAESCCYHVEVVLRVCSPLQIPDEDVPVMAGRQDDPGVERVRLQDKHLSLVALNKTNTLVRTWKL